MSSYCDLISSKLQYNMALSDEREMGSIQSNKVGEDLFPLTD